MNELEDISSFSREHLPPANHSYVAWMDIMGTSNMMKNFSDIAAVNICKLYLYVTRAPNYTDVNLYPMGDGVFVTTQKIEYLYSFLRDVFSQLAADQVTSHREGELALPHVSIIKATITAGEVREGTNFKKTRLAHHEHKNQLLFGKPVAQAHGCEDKAPPFGVYKHNSLKDSQESETWEWWEDSDLNSLLMDLLDKYYNYFSSNREYNYSQKKIDQHQKQARGYLQ